MLRVYCNYHNEYGYCTIEDYEDCKWGRNPSGMLGVKFETFYHGVPFHTITVITGEEEDNTLPSGIIGMLLYGG